MFVCLFVCLFVVPKNIGPSCSCVRSSPPVRVSVRPTPLCLYVYNPKARRRRNHNMVEEGGGCPPSATVLLFLKYVCVLAFLGNILPGGFDHGIPGMSIKSRPV